jgi:hypothetical protein
MLQTEVVKAVGNQIDIEDPTFTKYPITTLHHIALIFISIIVTINRTIPLQRYQCSISHYIMLTTKLRSSI